MESLVSLRLAQMAKSIKDGVAQCRGILQKICEGDQPTVNDKISMTQMKTSLQSFLTETHMGITISTGQVISPDLLTLMQECTTLQIEAECILSEWEVRTNTQAQPQNVGPNETTHESHTQGNTTRLPKLEMVKFDGNILHWHRFWDRFTSSVANKNLSEVDKMTYLDGCLEGEAKSEIDGLDITNANYKVAVDRLKERYGNPRVTIDTHWIALDNIPTATADIIDVRKVFNQIEKHLGVLSTMGEDINRNHLRTKILDKFPTDLQYDVRMQLQTEDEKVSVEEIRRCLKRVITAREATVRSSTIKSNLEFRASSSGFTTEAFQSSSRPAYQSLPGQQTSTSTTGQQSSSNANPKRDWKAFRVQKRAQKRKSDSYETQKSEPKKKIRRPCIFCGNPHFNDQCDTYPTIAQRKAQLKNKCFQCFGSHMAESCRNQRKCPHCEVFGKHNRALCPKLERQSTTGTDKPKQGSSSSVHLSLVQGGTVLQTAKAPVVGQNSSQVLCRMLFDTGSEKTYISEAISKKLGLKPVEKTSLTIYTFGNKIPKTFETNLVYLQVTANCGRLIEIPAYTVSTTTDDIAAHPHLRKSIQFNFPEFSLANDSSVDSPADIIIGNDAYHLFLTGVRKELTSTLYLMESRLGWIPSGVHRTQQNESQPQLSFLTFVQGHQTHPTTSFSSPDPPFQDDWLKELWEVEAIGITDSPKSMQDEEVIEFFNRTTKFVDGRYYVKWPWAQYPPHLPENYGLSLGRLTGLLKRTREDTLQKYDAILQEQLRNGVIEIVDSSTPHSHQVHYLPHHCVVQESKSTKIRIVYDGSSKVRGQCSLNDLLYKGPLMLEDMTKLLIRFRTHKIGLVADIEKAFLQVGLQDEDRDVTRFLWVKDLSLPPEGDNLVHLRFCRVPFGIVCSPFLLTATIRFHLLRHESAWSRQISKSLYVDNLVTGVDSFQQAMDLFTEARGRFQQLSMNIRAWSSNDSDFMALIPESEKDKGKPTSVLGLTWNQSSDQLMLSTKPTLFDTKVQTKRGVIRTIASIFDPCGFVGPLILPAKLFLQNLWREHVKWDTQFSDSQMTEWNECAQYLRRTVDISLNRHYSVPKGTELVANYYELHCFADASKLAYAAVVYLRISGPTGAVVSFVMSRLRLTPVRHKESYTIPKLELMAVLIGTRLLAYVHSALGLKIKATYLWTDSQIVLGWLKSKRLLPPFVTRRIAEITKSSHIQFNYVSTEHNPADVATRWLEGDHMPSIWHDGTPFLSLPHEKWPTNVPIEMEDLSVEQTMPVESTSVSLTTAPHAATDPPDIQFPEQGINLSPDTLKALQLAYFPDEFAGKPTSLSKSMGLFSDPAGYHRCKGRFQNSELTHDQQYPILLPKRSPLVRRLILRIHFDNLHVGVAHTLSLLRKLYWVPQGRSLVKSVIQKCSECVKYGGGPYALPPMAPLPSTRSTFSHPFTYTGLDYLGPLMVMENGTKQKRWCCLFLCMAVRAVHLEVINDQTAEEFTLALRRFVALRGTPSMVISDNAAQFKLVADVLKQQQIEWKFIPELSPWQGGFYERLVGLVKHCLRRTVDRTLLTNNQLITVFKEIESVLNTRPLIVVGDDIEHVLTPSDFLLPTCGAPVIEPPPLQQSTSRIRDRLVEGWRQSATRLQEFRRMFINQYLVSLREHHQSHHSQPRVVAHRQPTVGAVVQVKGETTNRGCWKVGKIIDLFHSSDGCIRTAQVELPNGHILTRSISHLYPLEMDIDDTPSTCEQPTPSPTGRNDKVTRSPVPLSADSRPLQGVPPVGVEEPRRPARAAAKQAVERIREWTRSLFVAARQGHPL